MKNLNHLDLDALDPALRCQVEDLAKRIFGWFKENYRAKPVAPRKAKFAPLAHSKRRHTTANEAIRREEAAQRDPQKRYHAGGCSFYCPPSQIDPELAVLEQQPASYPTKPIPQPIRDEEIKAMVRNTPRKTDDEIRQEFGISTLADEILQALDCQPRCQALDCSIANGVPDKDAVTPSEAVKEKPAIKLAEIPESIAKAVCRHIEKHYKVRPSTLVTGKRTELLYIPGDTEPKVRRNIAAYVGRQMQQAGV